jgi:hypothetical protein
MTTPPTQRSIEKVKRKQGDFTDLCLMGKSLRNISDSNSDVSDDLSHESLSLRVVEPKNALCNQDKLFCKIFHENKKLNTSLKVLSLKLLIFDPCTMMSAKPCDNCTMIMVNYADLWLMHSQVASQLKNAKLKLRKLKTRSTLLGV